MDKTQPLSVLERGSLYFFYRPKVVPTATEAAPKGLEDIQRFYIVLKPEQNTHYRLLIIGKKRLPESRNHERYWGTVDFVTTQKDEIATAFKAAHYETKTQGDKTLPAVRPCGEGDYLIVKKAKKTYLSYKLVAPKKVSVVQHAFHIASSASYYLVIKNQQLAGIDSAKAAPFPIALQAKMHDLRFSPADPVSFLDYPGAEFILIAINTKKRAMTPTHTSFHADSLHLLKDPPLTKPLFEGQWQ